MESKITAVNKPKMSGIEADRRECLTGIGAEKEAQAQGIDPVSASALMNLGKKSPVVHGLELTGVKNGNVTLACIMALTIMEEKFQPETGVERSAAGLLCFMDPAKAYEECSAPDIAAFKSSVQRFVFDTELTFAQMTAIDTTLKEYLGVALGAREDTESFTKPVPSKTPASQD